jgi:hypothetical protein
MLAFHFNLNLAELVVCRLTLIEMLIFAETFSAVFIVLCEKAI